MRCLIPFWFPTWAASENANQLFHNSPHLYFWHTTSPTWPLTFTVRLTQFRITMGTHFWVFVSTFLERGGAMGGSPTKQGKKTLHLQPRLLACFCSRHSQWPLLPRASPYGIIIRLLSLSLLFALQKSHGTGEPQSFFPLKSFFVILNLHVTHIWLMSFWKSTVA